MAEAVPVPYVSAEVVDEADLSGGDDETLGTTTTSTATATTTNDDASTAGPTTATATTTAAAPAKRKRIRGKRKSKHPKDDGDDAAGDKPEDDEQTPAWKWLFTFVAGQVPPGRSNHIAFVLRENQMGLFGGFGSTRIFNDVYVLNTRTPCSARCACVVWNGVSLQATH